MEKGCNWEQKNLINELTQGRELANQLKNHLDPTISPEKCELLMEKLLSSYDKALSLINLSALVGENFPVIRMLESPHSTAGSPRSDGSDHDVDLKVQSHRGVFKKRKILPKWSKQVRICSGTGLEGPLSDGYCWRKYGQKDILGANFPRAYYRCTHRNSQGCLATKQVQKSDKDSSSFEVTYRGRHTCNQTSRLNPKVVLVEKKEKKQNKGHFQPEQEEEMKIQTPEMDVNFETGLKVETNDLGIREEIFPSFSFPSTPIEPENLKIHFFSESLKENNAMGSYSPPLISPATLGSNYLSLSQCQMNNFGICHDMMSSEFDLTDIVSAPTLVTNSPIGDWDFSLDQVDIDPNFVFDIPGYFS